MSKKLLYLLPLLLLTACGSNQENVPSVNYKPVAVNYSSSAVKNAAETGLPIFVGSIGEQWANLGFLSSDELGLVQLGTPYPVFVLDNPGKINQTVSVADEWAFPVMVNNGNRCMLTVAKTNNQWEAVSIGSATLSKWLQVAEKNHPSLNIKTKGIANVYGFPSSPYKIVIINPSEEQPSFLLIPHADELIKTLPQYSEWNYTNPIPALSFEEIYMIFSALN